MKISLTLLLLPLVFLSACQELSDFSLEKPAPDNVLLRVDAPAAGIYWQQKKINCQDGKEGICSELNLLLDQLQFPPRSETVEKTLDDDYEKLQDKARFSREIKSSRGTTTLPPGRGDSFSFSVRGQELTAIVSGSVSEVRTVLLSPSGERFLPGSSIHQKTPYLERFVVANPAPGTWRLVSENISASKPVYSLTYETFVAPFPGKNEEIKIKAEILDDGEVVFLASGARDRGIDYEWDMGDGWAGRGRVVGHRFSPGDYIPEVLTTRDGAGETLTQAPFIVRKKKNEAPEIIPVNQNREELPSPPGILRAQKRDGEIKVAALAGSRNGDKRPLAYQYSLDGGSSWKDIFLLSGYFTLPAPKGKVRLQFRSLGSRGPSQGGIIICNFSGFYPLEARARGIVEGEKINLEILAGGCPGERWNILAPLWKRAAIF